MGAFLLESAEIGKYQNGLPWPDFSQQPLRTEQSWNTKPRV